MAIDIVVSMGGSKSLPDEMSAHLKRELDDLIAKKFVDADGKKWSQERIGEVLGCSQTQMSDMLRGSKFGPSALIAMSRESGKTIDELLGPTAPGYRRAHKNGVVLGKVMELLDRIDESGFGYAGKNAHIPRLMKEIRTLAIAQDDAQIQAELRAAHPTTEALVAAKPQKRRKVG